jgi:hypothetical protein
MRKGRLGTALLPRRKALEEGRPSASLTTEMRLESLESLLQQQATARGGKLARTRTAGVRGCR